jgi:16S rRNA processing protein RimM
MIAPEGWVWLARIKRTQGRKGEVFAEILTDFPEKFTDRRHLWLLCSGVPGTDPRAAELVHHWMHKGGIVLHFAGFDSISTAEELAGCVVAIPRPERAQLEDGDVYIGDLIGCELVDLARGEARLVGEIEDVDRSAGPVAMLVVRRKAEGRQDTGSVSDEEILVPFAKDYLRNVDLEAKRVEMTLPEGLVDLNRTELN